MYIENIEENRKWKTINAVALISLFIQVFYLFRYNFYHQFVDGNVFLIPLILISLLAFYFVQKRDYFLTSVFVLLPSTVTLFLMILYAGGVKAPGTFWIFLIPFYYGAFYKQKGAIVGIIITFLFLFSFLILDSVFNVRYELYNFDFENERFPNLLLFGVIFSWFSFAVLKQYNLATKKIIKANFKSETLLRVVLHDLSNHLTSISHRAKRLKREDEYFLKLERSAKRATEIISTVRKIQQADYKGVINDVSQVDLKELVSELIEDFSEVLEEKNIRIETHINTSKNCFYSNKNILTNEILGNILSNAIKFTNRGDKILFKVYDNNERLVFHIEDYGIGIPDDIRKGLFTFGEPTSRKGTDGEFGTGYGLPIMNYFLMSLGGKVEVCSEVGRGSVFKVEI
jgi:signal transduction histidine kinase